MPTEINVAKLGKVIGEDPAQRLADVFDSVEEIARATVMQLAGIAKITEQEAQAALDWAKLKIGVNIQVDISVEAPVTSGTADPFEAMLAAASRQTYDPQKAAEMARVMLTYIWDVAGVNRVLHSILKNQGTGYVTDEALADALDTWLIKVDQSGGDMLVNGQQVTILPYSAREEAWVEVTNFLEKSTFDQILRSAAVYRRAVSQSTYAQKMGGNVNVNLPSDVDDPDTIRHNIELALTEIAQALSGGRVASRNRKMACEYGLLLVPAMNNREVITSFGIPVGSNEDPLTAFLTNKRNPQTRLQTGMTLARVVYQAVAHFASYDPAEFEDFFKTLCEIGQEYCLAVDAFQKTSPAPVQVPAGQYVGFRQVAASIMAMVKVTVGGTTVEVGVSVGTKTITGPVQYQNTGDLRVLNTYISVAEARECAEGLLYSHGYRMEFNGVEDVRRQVMQDNEKEWARRILEKHPDIIWPSQVNAGLSRLRNSAQVEEIADRAGIDTAYVDFSSKASAVRGVVETALMRRKWEALVLEMKKDNIL